MFFFKDNKGLQPLVTYVEQVIANAEGMWRSMNIMDNMTFTTCHASENRRLEIPAFAGMTYVLSVSSLIATQK